MMNFRLPPLFFISVLLLISSLLLACGADKEVEHKTSGILFESQKEVLEDAKNIENIFAEEEQKRQAKMKESGL